MSVTPKDKIKELLGTGLSNEVVASSLGVHPSYISQLMSEESFYNDVIELRTKSLASHTVRDRSIDSLEDMVLAKLEECISSGMVYKHNDLLNCFRVINSAKRRGVQAQEATVINNTVVNLRLPTVATMAFKTNKSNEVIEVEGQTMVTMPASHLLETLIDSKEDPSKYEQVKKFLPQRAMDSSSSLMDKLIADSSTGDPIDRRQIKHVGNHYEVKHRGPSQAKE